MASSARASGSYLGSPENFAIRYTGGYAWYAVQTLGERGLGAGGRPVAAAPGRGTRAG